MRLLVGLVLIAAALLKAVELYQNPTSVLGDGFSRYVMPILIGAELGLGLSAIASLYWRQIRLLAMIVFAGFASYSLWLALHGASSCGCFGQLEVNPWWTLLLDMIVLAGLIQERVAGSEGTSDLTKPEKPLTRVHLAGVLVTSFALTIGLYWQVAPRRVSSLREFQTVGALTILDPVEWIGQRLPIAAYIDTDVSEGDWVLLLHRHDCLKCEEALPMYEQLAIREAHRQVAVIEVPPYAAVHEELSSNCHLGRLSDERDWFVETPVELQLSDSIVVSASTKLPAVEQYLTTSFTHEGNPVPKHTLD